MKETGFFNYNTKHQYQALQSKCRNSVLALHINVIGTDVFILLLLGSVSVLAIAHNNPVGKTFFPLFFLKSIQFNNFKITVKLRQCFPS